MARTLLLGLLCSGLLAACGGGDADLTGAAVSSTTPIAGSRSPETSVDPAAPPSENVVMYWTPPITNSDGSALETLAGYRIYHSLENDRLALLIDLPNPGLTSFVIGPFSRGVHFFAIAAYTRDGVESDLTEAIAKTFP